jgi:hypothetical protein
VRLAVRTIVVEIAKPLTGDLCLSHKTRKKLSSRPDLRSQAIFTRYRI